MELLNDSIREYTDQLRKGHIQKAYLGIMTFMSGLCKFLSTRHPDYAASALYFGYMDMTYFAFTPPGLKKKNLKIAVVYLHEEGRFEVWLVAANRKLQAETITRLREKDLGSYTLSRPAPGVDSIIEFILVTAPDFDAPETLRERIAEGTMAFARDMVAILGD